MQGAPIQKGRFTWVTEADRKEKWIVASIGKYSVLWNFRWALTALHTSSGSCFRLRLRIMWELACV